MRLWTLHPKFLDRQGFLAVWREGLLAQAVLLGNTRGYKNHPQLVRFKAHPDPTGAIAFYLDAVYRDSLRRGYHFDHTKYELGTHPESILATTGQLEFEWRHLLEKLQRRSPRDYARYADLKEILPHPLFKIVTGGIADWERGIA